MTTKVVFLDRDGVICEKKYHESGDERNYITKWEGFVWIPGSKEAVVKLLKNDYFVIVVSNQACVGKGIISLYDAKELMINMWYGVRHVFEEKAVDPIYLDARIDNFRYFFCPHTGEEKNPCSCRKPKPGMVYSAAYIHDLCLKDAWIVGDTMDDLKAGWLAGLRKLIQVGCEEEPVRYWKRNRLDGYGVPDLARAVDFILEYDGEERGD